MVLAYVLFILFIGEIAYILFIEGRPKRYRFKQLVRNPKGRKMYRIDYLSYKRRWFIMAKKNIKIKLGTSKDKKKKNPFLNRFGGFDLINKFPGIDFMNYEEERTKDKKSKG